MAHFGLIFPPGPSHVTATSSIGRELIKRGHRATAFNFVDVKELATKEGVEFCPIGVQTHPLGSVPYNLEKLSHMGGIEFVRFGTKLARFEITTLLEEGIAAMRDVGVTALLVDQGQPAGSTMAKRLNVPFASICNALHSDPDPLVPPPTFGWGPAKSTFDQVVNKLAWRCFDLAWSPLLRHVNTYRKRWNLKPLESFYETFSPVLELAQETVDFDMPRKNLHTQFHYIGVIHRTYASKISFPFDKLDGRPVIYASLGTVYDNASLFEMIAKACWQLDLQLIITFGSKRNTSRYDLPGSPIVVDYAPQSEVLKHVALTICHSGHNTVLDSLEAGVPVIGIPVQLGDRGIAARLQYSGAGVYLKLNGLTTLKLVSAIQDILFTSSYRKAAERISNSLKLAGGESHAADLIEQKLVLGCSCSEMVRNL